MRCRPILSRIPTPFGDALSSYPARGYAAMVPIANTDCANIQKKTTPALDFAPGMVIIESLAVET